MQTSASQLIAKALRIAGVLGAVDTMSSVQASQGLETLNEMLDSWAIDETYVYAYVSTTFAAQPGIAKYTLGPTGSTVPLVPRPYGIDGMIARMGTAGSQTDYAVMPITAQAGLENISSKNTTGIPAYYVFNASFPDASVSFYPAPAANQPMSFVYNSWQVLLSFVDLTVQVDLPPGYARAIAYALSAELAGENGLDVTQSNSAVAMDALSKIRAHNLIIPTVSVESAGLFGYGGFGPVWNGTGGM